MHPDFVRIQGMRPADIAHAACKRVWLRCPGCIHACGRQQEWRALANALTGRGGHDVVCPSC